MRAVGACLAACVVSGMLMVPAEASCRVITHRGLTPAGLENQPRGVGYAARFGWAEVDADLTRDKQVVAIHDPRLGRLTNGVSTAYVNELDLVDLQALPHPYGAFRLTSTLIGRAADRDVPVMITINRWGRQSEMDREVMVSTLHAAAMAHPHPRKVYFGGAGGRAAIQAYATERDQPVSAFHRYTRHDTGRYIRRHIRAEGIDLVGLPKAHYRPQLVRRIKHLGVRVATKQVRGRQNARLALSAGIGIIQGNNPRLISRRWCA